jgi:hypothetical protein
MGVTFNEPKYSANKVVRRTEKPFFLTALILQTGLAKNQKEVSVVLFGLLVLLVLLTGWVLVSGTTSLSTQNVPDPDTLL